MDDAKRGAGVLPSKDSLTAIAECTKALIRAPLSPDHYTRRSTAFMRLSPPQNDLALKDAELAVLCAKKRNTREKIIAAQLRRAIALFGLKQYHDAAFILNNFVEKGRPDGTGSINKDTSSVTATADMWKAKIHNKFKTMAPADLEAVPKATVKELPHRDLPKEHELLQMLKRQLNSDGSYRFEGEDDVVAEPQLSENSSATSPQQPSIAAAMSPVATTTATVPPMAPNIRYDWHQSSDNVTITIYAKGVAKDKAEVDIKKDAVSISFPYPNEPTSTFSLTYDPLFMPINAEASSYSVMSTKVEVQLKKTAGVKWGSIEGVAGAVSSTTTPTILSASAAASEVAPSYPTSSRHGPKNWDKLAKELTSKPDKKKKKSDAGSDNEVDPDYDSEYDETGDAGDAFFKKLYATSDPDVQRAMKKSYLESNGTALSTSWADVSKGPVKPVEDKKDDE